MLWLFFFFFFKQKTAYEMRISDWSSDVCSSDLVGTEPCVELMAGTGLDQGGGIPVGPALETSVPGVFAAGDVARHDHPVFGEIRVEIGRASCRERVCQYV